MKFALFSGCKIPFYLKEYELSSRAVLKALEVELIDLEFNCCGYPIRSYDFESFIFSSARNLALAEKQNLNIITPCMCCFGSLKHAEYFLKKDDSLKTKVNKLLQKEDLYWHGSCEVKHLLSVLFHDVGIASIKKQIKHPNEGLKVASSYGCHALRPGEILNFDNPQFPTIFEDLVNVTGAESVDWQRRLECCGSPLWEKNNELSLDLMQKKLSSAINAEADCLCSACTYCQIQFDTVQHAKLIKNQVEMPSILYPQLLGLSLGMSAKNLGLENNKIKINKLSNL